LIENAYNAELNQTCHTTHNPKL